MGIKGPSGVWMGADSCTDIEHCRIIRKVPKVWRTTVKRSIDPTDACREPMLLAGCNVTRVSQLVKHVMEMPPLLTDLECWAVRHLAPAIRAVIDANIPADTPRDATFMIAVRGELLLMLDNGTVEIGRRPYRAYGAGEDAAMGVIYACRETGAPLCEEKTIALALQAAAEFRGTVAPPWHIEKL